MFIVESGVVTCHMDFLRLHHRMHLPAVSHDILAVAPVRSATPAPLLLRLSVFMAGVPSRLPATSVLLLCILCCNSSRLYTFGSCFLAYLVILLFL